MKKLLTKILIGVLAVITMLSSLVGCSSDSSWEKPTFPIGDKEVDIVGGFIGEKGDYYYYINGVGVNTESNSFGSPVKGALVATTKDFSELQVVVPKLFVASDYKAGLYIYGEYVYYGTPNTDKTSSGDIANTELTFMRTKLDGTDSKSFFTLSSLSAEYRIVERDGNVYIVYYDTNDSALEIYDCNTGETSTIIKTDAEVAGANGESLNAYKFAGNGSQVILYYTTTVYAEEYNELKTEDRATANYNKIYAYGYDQGEFKSIVFKNGADAGLNPATYEIKLVKNNQMYYAETINGVATTYNMSGTKITNATALADTSLIVSDNEVYTVADGTIVQTSLVGNYNSTTKNVAIGTGATTLLAVKDGFAYFVDSASGISRIKLDDQDAKIQKVSEDTVLTAWYPVQFIGDYMFYCDNSAEGASYVKCVNVNDATAIKSEDTDDDGEEDKFYFTGHKNLGIITEADKISIATAKVNVIAGILEDGALPFETGDDGKLYVEAVDEAVKAVEGLDVSEETIKLLAQYQKAIEMANYYEKLEGIRYETNDKNYQEAYESVKDMIEAFRASEDYEAVKSYIGNNRLWNYQEAKKQYA